MGLLQQMAERFPTTHPNVLGRFTVANSGDLDRASSMLAESLKWRADTLPITPHQLDGVTPWLHTGGEARDGSSILLVQGARYDHRTATPQQYVLSACSMLERWAPQDSTKLTVLIDTRPSEGWANPPAHWLLPFFRAVGPVLSQNYPERMQVLYRGCCCHADRAVYSEWSFIPLLGLLGGSGLPSSLSLDGTLQRKWCCCRGQLAATAHVHLAYSST